MLAGRDTTSTALSWFFYLLAQNPSIEKKIQEEIEKKLGGQKRKSLGIKELGELVYLHGGICEALRLYPPISFEHWSDKVTKQRKTKGKKRRRHIRGTDRNKKINKLEN